MQILASECSGLTNRCDPQALLYRADAAVILTSRSKQFSVSANRDINRQESVRPYAAQRLSRGSSRQGC
jgi:hypothetical protein